MSDLQCPVRLFVTSPVGISAARALASRLAVNRILGVWSAPSGAARSTAGIVGEYLGLPAQAHEGLGGAAGLFAALAEIADLHRGEAVLVVGEADVLAAALEGVLGVRPGDSSRTRALAPGEVLEIHGDADGWSLRSTSPLGETPGPTG